MPDVLALGGDGLGQPAGGDDRGIGQLLQQALQDAVHLAHVAVEEAGLHGLDRVPADHPLGPGDLHPGQPGGPGGQGIRGDLDARQDQAAEILPPVVDHIEGGGGPEVHGDERRAVLLETCDDIHDAVRAQLLGIVQHDLDAGLDPGFDPERLGAEVAPGPGLQHRMDRGHHVGDGDAVDLVGLELRVPEQVHGGQAELVGGPLPRGGQAPGMQDLGARTLVDVVDPQDDVGVPDVNREE